MDFNEILELIYEKAVGLGFQLVLSLVILFVGLKLIKVIKKLIRKSLKKSAKLDIAVQSFIVSLTGIALLIGLIMLIIGIFNIETVSFAAVLGAAGLAIGLALQGSLSNFAGGFLILILKPFKPGDFIEVQGTMGTVEDMDIFYTKMKTFDNKKVVIPNSIVINNTLTNFSGKQERRIDLNVGVSYNADIKNVKEVIGSVVDSNILILKDPLPIIRLGELADSALIFHVKVWCRTADYWNAFYDINEGIKEALDKHGISIPYPQLDVHVKKDL
jgi:small conductance mechanosensitive channel